MKREELERLILETYGSIQESRDTIDFQDLPDAMQKALEKRHGKAHEKDFLSSDMATYYKTSKVDKNTGSVSHEVIQLPSFYKMYGEFETIINDIKKLMGNPEVRQDQAARELFELIKTNFRKLQTYLRTERPEQYAVIRGRAKLAELHTKFVENAKILVEGKNSITESLLNDLTEEEEEAPDTEDAGAPEGEDTPETEPATGTELADATDTILGRFPTLKQAIVKLQTEEFKEFVDSIDWISPRPSSFRVNLKNGQDYILKWTGKTFEAQILGKRYTLSNIADYQQALDKLSLLYREAPMTGAGTEEGAEVDSSGGGGGGGDFPGEEGGAEGGEDFGGEEGGEDLGGDEAGGGEDLSDEPIDFEDGAEPEA